MQERKSRARIFWDAIEGHNGEEKWTAWEASLEIETYDIKASVLDESAATSLVDLATTAPSTCNPQGHGVRKQCGELPMTRSVLHSENRLARAKLFHRIEVLHSHKNSLPAAYSLHRSAFEQSSQQWHTPVIERNNH